MAETGLDILNAEMARQHRDALTSFRSQAPAEARLAAAIFRALPVAQRSVPDMGTPLRSTKVTSGEAA